MPMLLRVGSRRAARTAGLTVSQCFFSSSRKACNFSSLGIPGLQVDDRLVSSVHHTLSFTSGTNRQKTNVKTRAFFANLAELHNVISPQRIALLKERTRKQIALDEFFTEFRQNNPHYTPQQLQSALENELKEIGYIPEKELPIESFYATTIGLASEILTPGPQAVVPADKANMVVNAINGRWGSAYESLNGSNLLNEGENEREYLHKLLDTLFEFTTSGRNKIRVNFSSIIGFNLSSTSLTAADKHANSMILLPKQGQKFLGYTLDEQDQRDGILLENNGLKIEIKLGKQSIADNLYPIEDIRLEASLTVIIDKEDSSVSATEIKARSEANIAQIINGTLTAELSGGRGIRALSPDTKYVDPTTDERHIIKRTAHILVRSVSDHLTLPIEEISIHGQPVSEKTWDLLLSAMSGVQYHVLPKMHNENEVALAMRELQCIEGMLGLPKNHLKVGIMNEEFEMNLRLREALQECRERVFFVNSGFLDKFGSDIEASMQAGAVASYRELNRAPIKLQYEKNNVFVSLQAGIAQIGAGMWARIKDQAGHKKSKDAQIRDGNDVSWNPDPKFAVLHALCYHTNVPVHDIKQDLQRAGYAPNKTDLYMPPLGNFTNPSQENYVSKQEITDSLREATFGLIGYATPWITKGVGCSAINDLNGDPLMEDRATARIKAAFLRNWLRHGIITKVQFTAMIEEVSKEISGVTDPVKNAILKLVLDRDNRLTALVEDSFMTGYQTEHAKEENVSGYKIP
ncbi:MAG: hypothetical protein Q8R24_05545 [Legionellaceae bacterium]|nr:hypothetical protein [Legionellaceae bacterium]